MLVNSLSSQKVLVRSCAFFRCICIFLIYGFLDYFKMSLDKELSGIARFDGDEFHIWKWHMKLLLQYKKIFERLLQQDAYY